MDKYERKFLTVTLIPKKDAELLDWLRMKSGSGVCMSKWVKYLLGEEMKKETEDGNTRG